MGRVKGMMDGSACDQGLGYVYVNNRSWPECPYEVHDGKVCMHGPDYGLTFRFRIIDIDRERKHYSLILAWDSRFKKPIFFAHIDYLNYASRVIDATVSRIDDRMNGMTGSFVALVHTFLFEYIISLELEPKDECGNSLDVWAVPITEEMIWAVEQEKKTSVRYMAMSVQSLIQK